MKLLKTVIILSFIYFVAPVSAFAAQIGDDGLHKQSWMRDTFKDLREDLDEANLEGKRLVLMFEQRGCVYCSKMHKDVYSREKVSNYIDENFFVVQLNLHGDLEVTDFDGEILSEKAMARKWSILFTPTVLYLPQEVGEGLTATQAAVSFMPGAWSAATTIDMLTWVKEERYLLDNGEDFQRYHARRFNERKAAKSN
ncbi:MAG: thioredoxin family protein [Paracoccaceae bacterium]|jgi:thioredoxin-related protein|tara:strand:- start:1754 stop:2344 length:591 start_codon:yes stop_codon:yes gene_type:complete